MLKKLKVTAVPKWRRSESMAAFSRRGEILDRHKEARVPSWGLIKNKGHLRAKISLAQKPANQANKKRAAKPHRQVGKIGLNHLGYQMFKTLTELKTPITNAHTAKSIFCHWKSLEVAVLVTFSLFEIKTLGNYMQWKHWAKGRFWAKTWLDMPKPKEMYFHIRDILLLSTWILLSRQRQNYSWSSISAQAVTLAKL